MSRYRISTLLLVSATLLISGCGAENPQATPATLTEEQIREAQAERIRVAEEESKRPRGAE